MRKISLDGYRKQWPRVGGVLGMAQFNHGLFESDQPRNYPLSPDTALCVNTAFAYPFYVAPIVFPKSKWLGLAPALFGISQAVTHGAVFPRVAGDKYSPGFLASIFTEAQMGPHDVRPSEVADWGQANQPQANVQGGH